MNFDPDAKGLSEHPAIDKLLKKVVDNVRACAENQAGEFSKEAVQDVLAKVVDDVRGFAEEQVSHIYELVQIGLGLSGEKNLERLLEMIVSEARRFTNADGGTLYIDNDGGGILDFAIVQNDTLNVHMGGTGNPISWPSIPLKNLDGSENHSNVSAHCALVGEPVNIPDVYMAEGFDFQGTKDFDATTGYRSKSMLLVPLRNHEDEVIGVLQLLNAKDRATGEVAAFPKHEIDMVISLASQAAIAITKMCLIKELEDLFNSFVKTISDTIDAKSPYTAGHVLRVAEMTERIAKEVDRAISGKFADVHFTSEDLNEIRTAAWLHDVGKITTPEYVMDKATKLETVFDRIEKVRLGIEILKRDVEIKRLKIALGESTAEISLDDTNNQEINTLEEKMDLLEAVNVGGEAMSDELVEEIEKMAHLHFKQGDKDIPLLDEDELNSLSVRYGTLTESERNIINNHVKMTTKMLDSLPFPKKLSRVPLYAGMHHEKLDGSGYPRGLSGDQIPLPARALALADILEALTAADRPYKPGKLLSESISILEKMAQKGLLDEDLCDLIIESGQVTEYAQRLPERQRDDFVWKGKKYSVNSQS